MIDVEPDRIELCYEKAIKVTRILIYVLWAGCVVSPWKVVIEKL